MKIKTINKVIKSKFKDWVDSIQDDEVKKLVKRDTIITGGCIASMLLRETINDYDVYFSTKETTLKVARYYLEQYKNNNLINNDRISGCEVKENEDGRISIYIKSSGVLKDGNDSSDYEYFESDQTGEATEEYIETVIPDKLENIPDNSNSEDEYHIFEKEKSEVKTGYKPVFLSSNAITLTDKIQIVIRFYGSPEEIHDNYDFVHCTNYWTPSTGVVTKKEALECLLEKRLVYIGSKYPVASIIRTRKFINRQFTVDAGQYLKMILQCNELNLNNIDVLKDQLVGVDAAFFYELLSHVHDDYKNGKSIDSTYICGLIDKIF